MSVHKLLKERYVDLFKAGNDQLRACLNQCLMALAGGDPDAHRPCPEEVTAVARVRVPVGEPAGRTARASWSR